MPTAAWSGPEDDWPEAPPYWIWWVKDPAAATEVEATPGRAEPADGTPPRVRVALIATAVALVAIVGTFVAVGDDGTGTDPAGAVAEAPAGTAPESVSASAARAAAAADTPEPEPDAESIPTREQAAAVDALLDQSKPSRGTLRQALSRILRCSEVAEGVEAIERVTGQRGGQAGQAEELETDALRDGDELKDALVRAPITSYRADKAYLKWAKRYRDGGCRGRTVGDSAYDAGNAASEDATAAKTEFVRLGNSAPDSRGRPRSPAESPVRASPM
ncbi:hypothetical protein ACQPZZ_24460 [Microbispora sp. CA-135349]|uniref:hypothetical protein n=1 Tax=Microbispora sp. CA-135349 TaxID=3239953 RepID=UPI003D8EAD7C